VPGSPAIRRRFVRSGSRRPDMRGDENESQNWSRRAHRQLDLRCIRCPSAKIYLIGGESHRRKWGIAHNQPVGRAVTARLWQCRSGGPRRDAPARPCRLQDQQAYPQQY